MAPPSEYGADIVTGEAQVLGNALGFGGPYVGIFAATKELIRKIPGRIAGITQDSQGRRGFVLTLQTREQHIRREKATSNICSNEQLCALAATVYMALMGKKGIPAVANLCVQKSHYLAEKLTGISGVEPLFEAPFFKEFAVKLPVPAKEIIDKMKEKLEEILQKDTIELERIKKAARKEVEEKYSWKVILPKIDKLLKR